MTIITNAGEAMMAKIAKKQGIEFEYIRSNPKTYNKVTLYFTMPRDSIENKKYITRGKVIRMLPDIWPGYEREYEEESSVPMTMEEAEIRIERLYNCYVLGK
jgi:hypothetical protein